MVPSANLTTMKCSPDISCRGPITVRNDLSDVSELLLVDLIAASLCCPVWVFFVRSLFPFLIVFHFILCAGCVNASTLLLEETAEGSGR